MHGRAKESADSNVKLEFCNVYDRLKSWLVIVRVRFSENSETGALDLKPLEQRNMKGIKLDFALESSRQGLNHHGAQGGFGAVEHDAQHCDRHDQKECDSADPSPTGAPLTSPERVRFSGVLGINH